MAAISILSCNSDDGAKAKNLSGKWALTGGSGTITGRVDAFSTGEITWTFHENHTVDIVNTVTDTARLSGLPSGTYHYAVSNSSEVQGCSTTVTVGPWTFGCATISSASVELADGFADGVGYTLIPMPQVVPLQ
ncbi:hypothetical protein HYN48_09090 [Flavobacterium magnum]|uniref:Lipocalin-like domain-containing protein n=1 Tax=Flavobacterium magnum TaxID=2162713 RepID=A0A2S0REN9_9FLAO|nr:hypothetical protein HYN48_09090 [Flavobacterium magnum]